MIEYKPDNPFFNWDLLENIPSRHWAQFIRAIPYDEIIKFYKDNPAIFHVIESGVKDVSNGND